MQWIVDYVTMYVVRSVRRFLLTTGLSLLTVGVTLIYASNQGANDRLQANATIEAVDAQCTLLGRRDGRLVSRKVLACDAIEGVTKKTGVDYTHTAQTIAKVVYVTRSGAQQDVRVPVTTLGLSTASAGQKVRVNYNPKTPGVILPVGAVGWALIAGPISLLFGAAVLFGWWKMRSLGTAAAIAGPAAANPIPDAPPLPSGQIRFVVPLPRAPYKAISVTSGARPMGDRMAFALKGRG
jgi:hypothetical protein